MNMFKFFKKKFIYILLVSILQYNSILVFANNEYININNKSDWESCLLYTINNLKDSLDVKIYNYNDNIYDLNSLEFADIAISSKGIIKGTSAIIHYTFKYKDNFKVIKAAQNEELVVKLNDVQRDTLLTAKYIVKSLIKDKMSDYEKEKIIHDYLVLNYEYDYKNFIKNSIPFSSYQIKNFLEDKTGVCEAYAHTFTLLSVLSGLECYSKIGIVNENNHVWNIIKINGVYYHVDVTADDPVPNVDGKVEYDYFNLSDEEMKKTHDW